MDIRNLVGMEAAIWMGGGGGGAGMFEEDDFSPFFFLINLLNLVFFHINIHIYVTLKLCLKYCV